MGSSLTGGSPSAGENCEFVDSDGDGAVALEDLEAFLTALSTSGPTATLPAGYVLADVVRGGLLYTKWWLVNGATEPLFDPPNENHPLYPDEIPGVLGQQSGSTTFRCKECHGWDYKGLDGAYGAGSHRTDIVGIQSTTLTPQALFDLLKSSDTAAGGHDMTELGMSDRDLWDAVKMSLEGVIETDDYIDESGAFFIDDPSGAGANLFGSICAACHGPDGDAINFGSLADPEYVGTIAAGNPWEFMHHVRFGHPASPMPSFELLQISLPLIRIALIGKYAATLPQ